MKLIVAAIDFSPAASAAMRRAAELAAGAGARLALLHVARHRSAWARIADARLPSASLHGEATRLRAEYGVAVEAHIAKGAPHKAIVAFARNAAADLVVMGLRGGFLQDLLGTGTAQRVRRKLAVPVLAVARAPRGAYRRILVTTNFSAASARGAVLAARMFPGTEIHLLHVCRPLFNGLLSAGGVSEPAREAHRRRAVLHALRELRAFAMRTGLERASLSVKIGSAAAAIRERAAHTGADLIVVGPAVKSWLEKLVLFSVTDALLSHADHDALIVAPGGVATQTPARGLRPPRSPDTHAGTSKWETRQSWKASWASCAPACPRRSRCSR